MRRGRRSRRRGVGAGAVFMAALGVWAFAPRAAQAADQHRVQLERAGAGVLILAAGAVAVWVVRRWWARTQGQIRAVTRAGVPAAEFSALTPAQFEQVIGALCRRDGCSRVRVVGGPGDLAADVIAFSPHGHRIVVQAKRYRADRAVGSGDVQRFGGCAFAIHRADIAVVITTAARYTPAAQQYARAAGIRLMAGADLAAWRAGSGPPPWA